MASNNLDRLLSTESYKAPYGKTTPAEKVFSRSATVVGVIAFYSTAATTSVSTVTAPVPVVEVLVTVADVIVVVAGVFDIVVVLVLDVHVPIDVVVVVDDAAARDATGVVVQASVVSTMGFDGGVGTDGAAAATVKTTGDED
ncbi:Hypothetical predicted protein [Octopus vulgaris]|uniref:Uncharacterized protein n=1 Tax=Octopus vulgaris TaxID=6645 RepID=A0AA36BIP4_OCTVU|nr:Hypothetical predicted protein [Octopus vulgaris]